MTDEQPLLAGLRAEIDRIDDQLHDLIMQRSTIIERVRQAKIRDRIKIRPAREADILYRLSERHHGVFPKQSLFRMWREMIVGTLALEAPFSVSVLSVGNDHGYEDLARDHFGSFSNLQTRPSSAEVIDLVVRNEATVGVLPYPHPGASDVWWHDLEKSCDPKPRIMGRLPFFGRSNAKGAGLDALVISAVDPEPSLRDVSVYSFDLTDGLSPEDLALSLEQAGLVPCRAFETGGKAYVEVPGFVPSGDNRLSAIPAQAHWLGVYSVPIDDEELNTISESPS